MKQLQNKYGDAGIAKWRLAGGLPSGFSLASLTRRGAVC